MPNRFLFTLTTGRSGTVYLTELLRTNLSDANVFHERVGYRNMGQVTPDASHFMLFNSVGNVPPVKQFWQRKFSLDSSLPAGTYVEVSHFLSKAGLLENLGLLTDQGREVDIVILYRDTFKILWSYINRFDFFNNGFTWLFTLDPGYPNLILPSTEFRKYGMAGVALWYILEMWTRAEYYRLLLKDRPGIRVHNVKLEDITTAAGARDLLERLAVPLNATISLPEQKNATKEEFFGQDMKDLAVRLVDRFRLDHGEIARTYFDNGRRLGAGGRVRTPPRR